MRNTMDININKLNNEECISSVKVNKEALFCWTMQYRLHIDVLKSTNMR